MLSMIVGRCHVADTNREVVAYVISLLKPGAWENLSRADRYSVMREIIRDHRANQELYRAVMRGF